MLTLNKTSGQGKEMELMLLLDYNEDRSLEASFTKKAASLSSNMTLNLGTAVGSIQALTAKVQIDLLTPYVDFGGGIYKMSDVKRMTTKDDFLKMPLKDRNCEVELFEDCRTRNLLEECDCVPWELADFQVNLSKINVLSPLVLRTSRYVIQKEETALRGILPKRSTAAQLVSVFMLMCNGLEMSL